MEWTAGGLQTPPAGLERTAGGSQTRVRALNGPWAELADVRAGFEWSAGGLQTLRAEGVLELTMSLMHTTRAPLDAASSLNTCGYPLNAPRAPFECLRTL